MGVMGYEDERRGKRSKEGRKIRSSVVHLKLGGRVGWVKAGALLPHSKKAPRFGTRGSERKAKD
jgi:hypothetical protein